MSKVPFTATSFTPILRLVSAYNYLNVRADAPWKTLDEFLAEAKRNPGNVSVGNAGPGGGNHMAALLLEDAAKVKFLHVPFTGGGPSVIGLMSGQVQSAMNIAPEGISNVQAGQLRILAVFGQKRLENFPNVPTGIEQGVQLSLDQWRGAVAPPNTPPDIVAALHDILKKVIEDPEFVSKMKELSTGVSYADGKTFGEDIKNEDKRYENLCQEQKLGDRYTGK
jgi:tripartite-type tricarboxylate transporter receptor subunit TctC